MDREQDDRSKRANFHVSDRRFWVDNETSIDEAPEPTPRYPSVVEELKARTEAAEDKLKQRLQELDEENASFRSRINKNLDKRLEEEKAAFLLSLLEVIDNFERAIRAAEETSSFDALLEGVRMNLELLLKRFQDAGVMPIDNLHQEFDPNESEALGVVEVSDSEMDHKVVEIVQQGYRLGDRVIRPAVVNVGSWRGSAEKSDQDD
jgi:molecular chaperone GrpE